MHHQQYISCIAAFLLSLACKTVFAQPVVSTSSTGNSVFSTSISQQFSQYISVLTSSSGTTGMQYDDTATLLGQTDIAARRLTVKQPQESYSQDALFAANTASNVDFTFSVPAGILNGANNATPVDYFPVKADGHYAVFYVDPVSSWESWVQGDLYRLGQRADQQGKGSRFSGFFNAVAEVPEPATMLLFGAGLLGISTAGLNARIKQ